MRRTIPFALALARAWLPSRVRAASPDTAVLPVEAAGKVPARYLDRVDKAVAGMAAGGARLVTREERAGVTRSGCGEDAACWADIGKQLLAHRVLGTTLAPAGAESYTYTALLVDVATGTVLGKDQQVISHSALANQPGKVVSHLLWTAPREEQPAAAVAAAPPPAAAPVAAAPPPAPVAAAPAPVPAPAPPPTSPEPVHPDEEKAPLASTTLTTRPARDRRLEPAALLGARFGLVIPQALNKLETNFLVEIEGAYQLPFWHRRLGLFLDVGYTQPEEHGSHPADPRIQSNGGTVDYDMKVQELGFALGVQYRHAVGRWVVPFIGAAAKMNLTMTTVAQHAGSVDLGTNTEQSTRFGFLARGGVGFHLGPGDLVVEVHFEYTPVDHLITGDNNTGHLAFQLGYLIRI